METTFISNAMTDSCCGADFNADSLDGEYVPPAHEPTVPPRARGWHLHEPFDVTDPCFEYVYPLDGGDGAELAQALSLCRTADKGWTATVTLDVAAEEGSGTPRTLTTQRADTASTAFNDALRLAEGQLAGYARDRKARAQQILADAELCAHLVAEAVLAHCRLWAESGRPETFVLKPRCLADACFACGVEREPLNGASLVEQGIACRAEPLLKDAYRAFSRLTSREAALFHGHVIDRQLPGNWVLTAGLIDGVVAPTALEFSRHVREPAVDQTLRMTPCATGYEVSVLTDGMPTPAVEPCVAASAHAALSAGRTLADRLVSGTAGRLRRQGDLAQPTQHPKTSPKPAPLRGRGENRG
ncbi:hypothetical protein [Ramlibacter alkalitolerans]|uniref:Uncharacterized protein n=1 Tax=Ramlibacter alkalitolerans TaxID=2039631 RepID=A0ABS1JU90_9BURK|nr:hypothetical protein [Ramlibacter alkalitolerans]MBL0427818.1 hypothetical protein [Ramlibacter alkalitolerans]